jgi:hypothetical protein
MDRLEAPSAANSRPECVPEDAHYVPVTHCNPWYIRVISAPPGGLEPPAYGLEVRLGRSRPFPATPDFQAETLAAVAFLG